MSPAEITHFLSDTITARIGIRVIAEHHLALNEPPLPHHSGIINHQLSPLKVINQIAPYVQELCEVHYGTYPDFIVNGHLDTTFPYISVHLEYMLMELLKNAFRATVECSERLHRDTHPPVEITIGRGKEDVTIRIRDRGGGIRSDRVSQVWEYAYTTVEEEEEVHGGQFSTGILSQASKIGVVTGTGGPMAGLGYGLPMTRIYAQWTGGSLDLVSMYGHGCDVFLRLPHIGNVESMSMNV